MAEQTLQNRKTGARTHKERGEATDDTSGVVEQVDQTTQTARCTTTRSKDTRAGRETTDCTPDVDDQFVQTRKPDATTDTAGETSDVVEQTHQATKGTRNAATTRRRFATADATTEATDNASRVVE